MVQATAIVFLVATLTFVLIHLAPGDPFGTAGETALVAPEILERQRRAFGLDQPLPVQYWRYVRNLARGDLGYSFSEHRPALEAIAERIPNTLLLAVAGLAVAFGLGVPLGVLQGARPGSKWDSVTSVSTLVLYALPVFWVGLMLQLVFAERLHWFPVAGAVDPALHAYLPWAGRLADRAAHLTLPAVTLGLVGAAVTARYQRSAMIEATLHAFMRAARARGLRERVVIWRHALRNALLPTVTLFGLAFPLLLSGTVLVETVFSWPGMGRLLMRAISARDYHVVTGTGIIAAVMVVLGNLMADALYRWADPRTRERL
jgi:peptide/nickel transport system permease protein